MLFLALRALFFVVLLPGTVAVFVPFRMLVGSGQLSVPALGLSSACAFGLAVAGGGVLLRSVWDFFVAGKGTLAPVDPPRVLVVRGLYRYTRNPMYNGVLGVLLGEAWLFGSLSVLAYALVVFVAFHLFVVLYEEPMLEWKFAGSCKAYRAAVPRWGFTTHPFEPARARAAVRRTRSRPTAGL